MRIIAGEFRGRKLLPPASDVTRPITDRAKQSLFDVLTPLLADAAVYDCFAGTGSMGLESLSRGASHATFFERDRTALQRLKQNIATLKVEDRARIISGDLFSWFDAESSSPVQEIRAEIVFFDPPYRFVHEQPNLLQKAVQAIVSRHLKSDGTVVFRHDPVDNLELSGLTRYDQREYGRMTIELLRPRG